MFRIKYVGWCHVCKYYGPEGGFICGCCNVKDTCDRPSEYVERRDNVKDTCDRPSEYVERRDDD